MDQSGRNYMSQNASRDNFSPNMMGQQNMSPNMNQHPHNFGGMPSGGRGGNMFPYQPNMGGPGSYPQRMMMMQGANNMPMQGANNMQMHGNNMQMQGANNMQMQGANNMQMQRANSMQMQGAGHMQMQGASNMPMQGSHPVHQFGNQQGMGMGQFGNFPQMNMNQSGFHGNQQLQQQMCAMQNQWPTQNTMQQQLPSQQTQNFQMKSPGFSKEGRASKNYRDQRQPSRDFKERHSNGRSDRDRSPRRDSRSRDRDRGGRLRESRESRDRRPPERDRRPDFRQGSDRKRNRSPSTNRSPSPAKDSVSWSERGSQAIDKYLQPSSLNKNSDSEDEVTGDAWVRCSPADLYFTKNSKTGCTEATKKMQDLERKFEERVLKRAEKIREGKPKYEPQSRKPHIHQCHHHDDCSSGSSDSDEGPDLTEEIERKKKHPERIHPELWFNEKGEMNDGPLCRCSIKSRKFGIRHGIYPGEEPIPKCDPNSNNFPELHHYRVVISPTKNFQLKSPTTITYDSHVYTFEGFSLLSHFSLEGIPPCKMIRFNMEYKIQFIEEDPVENFSIKSLDMFYNYMYKEILELVDEDWRGHGCEKGCSRIHLLPRFARELPENGKEILSVNEVLNYLMKTAKAVVNEMDLATILKFDDKEWQGFVDTIRGYIVTRPGMRPSSIRVDNLDRGQIKADVINYPTLIHFGKKPAQMSYVRDPLYMRSYKKFVKFRHLLALKPRVTSDDREKLSVLECRLQEIRLKTNVKRDVTIELSCEGWIRTGLKADVCQHALMLPILINHLRLHKSFTVLEEHLGYKFKDPALLRLALTHPSQRVFYGINPDHDRNSLSNCGFRFPEFGNRVIFSVNTRKRGIMTLLNIMSQMGYQEEKMSDINHNERLEFLGDAVVELLTSVHLYYMFPDADEGVLTAYRSALVQNQHLALLGRNLHVHKYMLYIHGPDLCHEVDLKHAMANCFEAIMGALLIDGGIEVTDKILVRTLFEDQKLRDIWMNLPLHPLQNAEPDGDRHWIQSSPVLQKLLKFEEDTGLNFTHVRLLARAFTQKHIGVTNLTLGHNETLEFLGDSILKLITSDYLFRHFPNHHEGHLSLLRSVLVNKNTQSVACDDLGMREYTIKSNAPEHAQAGTFTLKAKADLLEALIGALYVDKGLKHCETFCNVVFFPRLKFFILTQEWNDPKSLLQQCCLSLRKVDEESPEIPIYKVVNQAGPTNTRIYTVAVYFRHKRLAKGTGHNIQQAEMDAAENALKEHERLFPQKLLEIKYKTPRQPASKDRHAT